MKKIFSALFMILLLNGCTVIEKIEESLSDNNAESEWSSMCHRYDLFVCGDDIQTRYKATVGIEEVILFNYGIFEYKKDNSDEYDYLTADSNSMMYGDCEDFAITFMENNIVEGNLREGEGRIVFGRLKNGDYHMWAIVTKNGTEYIFDTNGHYGDLLQDAYSNEVFGYRELATLYNF